MMIQYHRVHIICLALVILLGACKTKSKPKPSAIVVKMSYTSKEINSHGGRIILQNTDTDTYHTGSSRGESSYILLEGIPSGTYKVRELVVFYANYGLTLADTTWFNRIEIQDSKIYYLGNYQTKLMEPEAKFVHSLSAIKGMEKETIVQELSKRNNNNWFNVEIARDQTLFKNNTTLIERSTNNQPIGASL